MKWFTLDTQSVIAGANGEVQDCPHIDDLVQLARAGEIGLALASAFEVDQQTASAAQHQTNRHYLRRIPVLRVPGPVRFSSDAGPFFPFFGGPDVFADDEMSEADKLITDILLGDSNRDEAGRRMIDVHHLAAHLLSGNDVFVTRDKHMVRATRRNRLRSELGIVVAEPPEAVGIAGTLGQSANAPSEMRVREEERRAEP